MKILRYQTRTEPETYGWILDARVGAINGDIFGIYRRLEASQPIEHVKILPPTRPSKIIAIRKNFLYNTPETGPESVPEFPQLFLKPPSSVSGTNQNITIPPQTETVTFSPELAIVIGKQARWVPLAEATNYIFGYTCALNFFSSDILDRHPEEVVRAYGFDTFTTLGPWIETDLLTDDLLITSYINDQLIQLQSLREMLFSIPQLISFASSFMTLEPGDILLSGGNPYPESIKPGDKIRVEIEALGTLQTIAKQAETH